MSTKPQYNESNNLITGSEQLLTLWKKNNNLINSQPYQFSNLEKMFYNKNLFSNSILNKNIPNSIINPTYNISDFSILVTNLDGTTKTISFPISQQYITIETLETAFSSNNILPGAKCLIPGYNYLEFYYQYECYPTSTTTNNPQDYYNTWFIPNIINSTDFEMLKSNTTQINLLQNTIPKLYDSLISRLTYNYKIYISDSQGITYNQDEFSSFPFFAYILEETGILQFFGGDRHQNSVELNYITGNKKIKNEDGFRPRLSYIRYVGDTGFDNLEMSGNIVVDGSLNINGNLNISGGNIFIDGDTNFNTQLYNDISNISNIVLTNQQIKDFLKKRSIITFGDTSFNGTMDSVDNVDRGLNIHYYYDASYGNNGDVSENRNAFMGFVTAIDNSNSPYYNKFVMMSDVSLVNNKIILNDSSLGDLVVRNLTVSGDLIVNGQNVNSSGSAGNENFFFFFLSKPYPPVYLDGCYNYLIPNYKFMNKDVYDFSYGNDSSLNRLDISSSQNLQLYFKIPPRRFINWNYNHQDESKQNYIPDYNNLVIQYRSSKLDVSFSDNSWTNLISINLPDPSNQIPRYDGSYNNDLSMNFILDISKNDSFDLDTSDITITTENSFNILYKYGLKSKIIKISQKYQFRIYIDNYSNFDISQIPGIIPNYSYNQYNESINDVSWNYLYFPSDVNNFYLTLERGNPLEPTTLNFSKPTDQSNNFIKLFINGSLDNQNADSNSVISFPINQEDNYIVFTLDLSGYKSTNYTKAIPYPDASNLVIDFSYGDTSQNNFTKTITTLTYLLQPEYIYNVSNYGIYFTNKPDIITYATLPNPDISGSFTISYPLRKQVNLHYDNVISNSFINIFYNDNKLYHYRSDICYTMVTWRHNSINKSFNFFIDTSAIFDISYSSDIKLYNSTNYSSKNQVDELRGEELSGNNLSTFQLSTYKNTNQIHSSSLLQTRGTFHQDMSSIPDISFTLNLKTEDITGSTNPYTRKNGYYIGTTINDISFAIDLNNFFDIVTDLSDNNIIFKPQITQRFPDGTPFDNSAVYPIYKITDDLSQSFVIETSSITIAENSGTQEITTSPSPATYFGLTSKQPNSNYQLIANGSINISGLSKYIRSTTDSLGSLTITITGQNAPNAKIISSYSWPSSGINNAILDISQIFKPFSSFTATSGTYDGIYQYQAELSGTLYNNVFTPDGSKSINPIITISNYDTNLTTSYFWDTTRADTTFFSNNSMIRFDRNPLENANLSYTGKNYTVSDRIIYNQALFQNSVFWGGSNSSVYKDYSHYLDNFGIDYDPLDNSGDNISVDIPAGVWWYQSSGGITINGKYKWLCIKIENHQQINGSNVGVTDGVIYNKLTLSPIDRNNNGTNIIYFIKTNFNTGWLNCQRIYNNSPENTNSEHLAGIYDGTITRTTNNTLMRVAIPSLNTKNITELYILIGIKEGYNVNYTDFSYNWDN